MSQKEEKTPLVGVIMGSASDWGTMQKTCDVLEQLGVPYEKQVASAHRTPGLVADYASGAAERGLKVIIAGAGGAAHLAGVIAAHSQLPVIGVPMQSQALSGMDSLLSTVQMPGGIPVATMAIGNAGATNAGLFAAQILALGAPGLPGLQEKLRGHRTQMAEKVLSSNEAIQ